MNWGSLLFSTKGRLSANDFLIGALVLIGVSFLINLAPLLHPSLSTLGLIGLVMIWCWIALWVKRLHDAGQSGWMIILAILAWIALSFIITGPITAMFGVSIPQFSGDFADFMAYAEEAAVATALPNAVAGFISSLLIVLGANMVLKSTPGENQHSAATGPSAESSDDDV
jgi:uncharacterized membrane protein YhaH (DUF805 family)